MALQGKIITYHASDGLRLKGYLALAGKHCPTIIHIHGNFGNFYENEFIPIMAEKYLSAGINFLSVNNRGHDGIAEAYHNNKLIYTGGAIENPNECLYDIDGAISFARAFSKRIILQGHSFGCTKVLYYLIQRNEKYEFILLSPSNVYKLQSHYISPETLPEQIRRIRREFQSHLNHPNTLGFLPPKEFGIKQSPVEYHIPISVQTFLNLFESRLPKILNYDSPLTYYIRTRAFVYYGQKDALWTESSEKVKKFFSKKVASLTFLSCKNGDHHFHGLETFVIQKITDWVQCRDGGFNPTLSL